MARIQNTRQSFLISVIVLILLFSSHVVKSENNNSSEEGALSYVEEDGLPLVTFKDISEESGLGTNIENWAQHYTDTESFSPGVSWGDYDNDGYVDIFITANFNGSDLNSLSKPHLMHNNGDGTFSDTTVEAGLSYDSQSLSGVWGDYDNDGDLDLYISEFGTGYATRGVTIPQEYLDRMEGNENATEGERWDVGRENKLFQNNGDGTFSDVTQFANVGNPGHSTVAQWVDYDLDGDLDLYSLNWGVYLGENHITLDGVVGSAQSETNILYRNNGDGTFSDTTNEAKLWGGKLTGSELPESGTTIRSSIARVDIVSGTSSGGSLMDDSPEGTGMSWAALWFDFNMDLYPDVFIASDFGISPLYLNNGDGTFTMHTVEAGLDIPGTGMGVDAGDYDLDGDLDLCQSNLGPEYIWMRDGDSYQQVVNTAKLADTGIIAGTRGAIQTTWVCEWFDYDNDADVDLFLSAGTIDIYISVRDNVMYLNNGDWSEGKGNFVDVLDEVGLFTHPQEKTQGAAVADFDNDGDLDLLLGNSNQPIRLFENLANEQVPDRHWIILDLVGTESNRQGVGAFVQVTGEDGIKQNTILYACSGSFGCSDERLHFGLGSSEKITVKIWWPSGNVDEYTDLKVDRIVTLYENKDSYNPLGIAVMLGFVGLLAYILHRKG